MKQIPDFLTLYSQLIALPTISSTEPEFDQSNKALIELLADWLVQITASTGLNFLLLNYQRLVLLLLAVWHWVSMVFVIRQ